MNLSNPDITMVIPAYNEGARIAPTLRDMIAFLGDSGYAYELIVVDDGSSDGTFDVVGQFMADEARLSVVRHPKNLGKGMAVKSGFLAARGEVVFFSDADHSTPIEEVPRFMETLQEGYDIVIGSRAMADSKVEVRQPWYRESMGKAFNLLVQLFTVRGIRDTQCGFKCFKREACGPVFARQRLCGFCFDVELLFIAKKRRLKIAQVPVRWRNSLDSHVHTVKDSLRMFRDLLRIRLNSLLGRYR